VGFLGGAQIDRFANINSTVIGDYEHPKVRLPGAGGAPEIASACGQIFVIMRQGRRSFVPSVDFITSFGFGEGGDHRQRVGLRTAGPTLIATDLCVMRPDAETRELTVVSLHEGVSREHISGATGWPVRFAGQVEQTPPPTATELDSSTLPQKRNPVDAVDALASARLAIGLVPVVLGAMAQEHERAVGGWQAEWAAVPQLFCFTAGAVERVRSALYGLEIRPERMRANLELGGGSLHWTPPTIWAAPTRSSAAPCARSRPFSQLRAPDEEYEQHAAA
jgi:hypothetical protein